MVEFLWFYGAWLAIEVTRRCAARLRIRRKPCCQGRARRPKCESEEILDDVPNLTQHISSFLFGIEIVILLKILLFILYINILCIYIYVRMRVYIVKDIFLGYIGI